MQGFPELVGSYPLNGASNILLGTQLTLDWSVDIDTAQLTDSNELAKRIVVVDEGRNEFLNVQFVGYVARSRRITLNIPGLRTSTKYKLTVRSGFKDANGRRTIQEYHVGFTTAEAQFSTVALINPPDSSTLIASPYQFTWSPSVASTGVVSLGYDVNFYENGIILGTFTTPTNSLTLTPGSYEGVLGELLGRSLGWDVTVRDNVGATGTATYGPPTDRWTVLFSQPSQFADPSSSSRYIFEQFDTPASFTLLSITPEDNETHLSSVPYVKMIFTQPVASGTVADSIYFTRKDQMPRNDIVASYLELPVSGSWVVSGQEVTFTFTEPVYANTRYTISVLKGLRDVNGQYLTENFKSRFSTQYDPYYVDARLVKAKLRSEASTMPDDLINFYIYTQSLQANALFQASTLGLPGLASAIDSFPESMVRDGVRLRGYAVLNWVLSSTLYEIYASILIDEIRNVGRKRKLADFEESLNDDFLAAIKMAQEKVQQEMEHWRTFLTYSPSSSFASAGRGDMYNYDAMTAGDWSLDCAEKGRGDYV